jgi:single-strand DNA-binding protein
MAGSVNKVIVVGRLGQAPEVKAVGTTSVAKFSVATSETWTKDGQKQERTEWHRVVVWGKMAENCGKYLDKGRQVYVEGKLQTRSWEDKDGTKKYSTEIVASTVTFLGSANDSGGSGGGGSSSGGGQDNFEDFGPEPSFDNDDDIPF